MHRGWLDPIGVRLGLAVAVVLLGLAVVTVGLSNLAFERSARSVEEAAVLELEQLTRSTMHEIAEREAQLLGLSLEQHAVASRTAAEYLGWQIDNPSARLRPLSLIEAPSGHWFDPDPDRQSFLHIPRENAARPEARRDARASLVLDDLFPSLLAELEDGVGIYYLSPDGVARYHPPIDFHDMVDPDFDVTTESYFLLGTPELNPERATRWTNPYRDDAGHGLLVTVVTPVYSGGEFRGVVDVDVSLARLGSRLTQVAAIEGSFAFLLDGAGNLIAASPKAMRHLGYVCDLSFGPCLDTPEFATLLDQVRDRRRGIVALEERDDPIVFAHAPLQHVGWSLSIGVPSSVLDASARQIASGIAEGATVTRLGIAVVTAMAFIVALVMIAVTTHRWVVRPITTLAEAARGLGSAAPGAPLPLDQPGEFRLLAEDLDRLSHTLARQRREILDHQRHLERLVSQRTRDLGNLLAISADMSAISDPGSLMSTVLERLHDTLPFASAQVWLIEGEQARRVAAVVHGGPDVPALSRLPRQAFIDHLDLANRQVVRAAPLASDHPLRAIASGSTRTMMVVPLAYGSRVLGVLAVADPEITEAHVADLVGAVGQQLGTALENARLLVEARERSALEERQHLARELHDSVSQALFGVVLGLHTAKKEITNLEHVRRAIDYAVELAEAALKEMRALIFELRPESLETEGLSGLLERQAEMLRARQGLEVDLQAEEPRLPLNAKAVLYRVAQEALHNVVKHARATRVRVAVTVQDDVCRLEVADDGRGFVERDDDHESFGLHSMRGRMTLLGGRLDVRSEVGSGTTVIARLSVQAHEEEGGPPALALPSVRPTTPEPKALADARPT